MIRNEDFRDGVCVSATVIDLDNNTITTEEMGVVVAVRAMTAAERAAHTPPADPRAELIAQIEQATTVAKLRAAVLTAIESGAL